MKLSSSLIVALLSASALTAVSGFRDQTQKKSDSLKHRNLQDTCTIDHSIVQTVREVNVYVKAFPDDQNGLFDISLSSPPYAPPGQTVTFSGWCIDYDRFIDTASYSMDVFSAYSKNIHTDAVDKPQYFPNLAWLINNVNVGDTFPKSSTCEGGKITWKDLQNAVWMTIDDRYGDGFYAPDMYCRSRGLADLALAEGNNYQLDCKDPNEQIPLVFVVDKDSTGKILNQVIMSETKLSSIPNMCNCEGPVDKKGNGQGAPLTDNKEAKNIYEMVRDGDKIPYCGDIGQNEPFQGAQPLYSDAKKDCVKVNICHGNAGFGWNAITVDRDAIGIDNNGNNGHANFEHNDPSNPKRPDYFPNTYSMPNPNGAGINNGYLDGNCGYVCPQGDSACQAIVDKAKPTDSPTASPTAKPTATPTAKPTASPTAQPTVPPTNSPTAKPTGPPTGPPRTTVPPPPQTTVPPPPQTTVPPPPQTTVPPPPQTTVPPPPQTTVRPPPQTTVPPPPQTTVPPPPQTTVPPPPQTTVPPPPPQTTTPPPPVDDKTFEETKPPKQASTSGDPHFKTWTGDKFDYHGECDLVLVDNPSFANGLGMRVHIRTTRVKYFSYIEQIALQIGNDVLEFNNDVDNFFINGAIVEAPRKYVETTFSGYPVRRDKKAISIRLDEDAKAKIDFIARGNGFPAIILDGGSNPAIFQGSLGLLGEWKTGMKLARDGVTDMDISNDATAFALEWQVRDTEPLLFQFARFPQYPTTCVPPAKIMGNRLGMANMRIKAEAACANWKDDMEDCIFDVIATRSVVVAADGNYMDAAKEIE